MALASTSMTISRYDAVEELMKVLNAEAKRHRDVIQALQHAKYSAQGVLKDSLERKILIAQREQKVFSEALYIVVSEVKYDK